MKFIFVFCLVFLFPIFGHCVNVINGDIFFGNKDINADTVIAPGITYAPDSVSVTGTVFLENNGVFETDVYLCDRCDLYIKNHGVFESKFYLGDSARLFHVATESNDMIPVDFGVDYYVLVDGADGLNWSDVIAFAENANGVVLQNSVLDINGLVAGGDKSIEINGEIRLLIDDLSGLYDTALFTNVYGDGVIHIVQENSDVLFSDVAYIHDGSLIITRRRETDYAKIFDDDLGQYLNSLREKYSGDDLLLALDAANDMNQIYELMSDSARLNPDVLLSAMYKMDQALRIGGRFRTNGLLAGSVFVFSDDLYVRGLDFAYSNAFESGLNLSLGLSVGDVEYESKLDGFDGLFYSVDLMFDYSLDTDIVFRGDVGFSHYMFDIDSVYYHNRVFAQPDGIGLYTAADVGYTIVNVDSFSVVSFVGTGYSYNKIETYDNRTFYAYTGVDVGYMFEMLGIRYNYDLSANVNSDLDFGIIGRVAFLSEIDMLGGEVSVGILNIDDSKMYVVSVGAHISF